MNFVDIIYALAALACGTAAVLAWLAKVKWSKEFATAKDATISAKDAVIQSKDVQIESINAQLDSLRELTPMKIREYFLSVRMQLEEYNNELQKQLERATVEIESKNRHIEELISRQGEEWPDMIIQLQEERDEIKKTAENLEKQVAKFEEQYGYGETVPMKWPSINLKALADISTLSQKLEATFANRGFSTSQLDLLSAALKKSFADLQAIPDAYEKIAKFGDTWSRVNFQVKEEAQSAKPEPEKKEKKE